MTKSKRVHKWAVEFNPKNLQSNPSSAIQLPCTDLTPPVGFIQDTKAVAAAIHGNKEAVDTESLLVKKSWDIALGPLKQIPMNLFIMWMAGNTISIFPIMMVGMMFFRPISALFNLKQVFPQIQGKMAPLQKVAYCLGNVVCLGLAVYKCQVMGLLPTTASDWLAFEEPQKRLEYSGGGISL